MKKIVMFADPKNSAVFDNSTRSARGLSGLETFFYYVAQSFADLPNAYTVESYTHTYTDKTIEVSDNFTWRPIESFDPKKCDAVFVLGDTDYAEEIKTKAGRYFYIPTGYTKNTYPRQVSLSDNILCFSNWQADRLCEDKNVSKDKVIMLTKCVTSEDFIEEDYAREQGKVIFTGSTYRLSRLLDSWQIVRQNLPYATLHMFSSFVRWGMDRMTNDTKLTDLYRRMDDMKELGVFNHVHVDPDRLRRIRRSADILVEDSPVASTGSASLLESMAGGLIPVVSSHSSYLEYVQEGITGWHVPYSGFESNEHVELLAKHLISAIKAGDNEKREMRRLCRRFASRYVVNTLVPKLSSYF